MSILNIPIVPGYDETLMNSTSERFQHVQQVAEDIGYPVVIKPSGGGGGIGMMIARNREELKNSVHSVEGRGRKLFGVSSFYVEKLISDIKHIEFQVLADQLRQCHPSRREGLFHPAEVSEACRGSAVLQCFRRTSA